MNEVERKWKEKSTITVQVSIPLLVWDEWNADCESRFNGTRYLKMMHDHELANKQTGMFDLISQEIVDIKMELVALKQPAVAEKPKKLSVGNEKMGKFSYLLDKGEVVIIPDEKGNDIEFEIKPLLNKDMDVFLDVDANDKTAMINKLMTVSLQQTDEEITLEDVETLPLKYSQPLMEAVMKVNGLQ